MKILITGGLGYLGSALITTLGLKHELTVVDNLYTQRYCTLFNRSHYFKFIEQDFRGLKLAFLQEFDVVIHLAAIVDAANSESQKELVNQVNTEDTINFIHLCEQANVKLIFPSSTSVYGTSKTVVLEDDESALNPQSPYAESKITVENELKRMTKLDWIILRLGTVCGISKGMRFQTCINKFCFQAIFKQPLTVWEANMDLCRPYLTLDDFIRSIWFVLQHFDIIKHQTFNILTKNFTLRQIINKIRDRKPEVEVRMVDCPLLNQFSYEVSTMKIENLGFQFHGCIEYAIEDIIGMLE